MPHDRPVYEEHQPPPALAAMLLCEWERPKLASARELLVVPDGCVDLVWRTDGSLFVAGPDRGPTTHPQPAGVGFVGVRLRPGVAGSVVGESVDNLCDGTVALDELWGQAAGELAEQLATAHFLAQARQLLAAAVATRLAAAGELAIDRPIVAAADELSAQPDGRALTELPDDLGISVRQFHRRFIRQIGYGPKTYQRIMRFRRTMALVPAWRGRATIADLAAAGGYADQAHFTRECRRLTGATPAQLRLLRPASLLPSPSSDMRTG